MSVRSPVFVFTNLVHFFSDAGDAICHCSSTQTSPATLMQLLLFVVVVNMYSNKHVSLHLQNSKVHSLSQRASSVKDQYPWLNLRTINTLEGTSEERRPPNCQGTNKAHVLTSHREEQRNSKSFSKEQRIPQKPCHKETASPHTAVLPTQHFPSPRRGLSQPSTFNCLRTRSQKRLVGTHVTVVTGPCASSQKIPSVLRQKKSVHHPGH